MTTAGAPGEASGSEADDVVPAPKEDFSGRTLAGKFQIEELLGEGAMGRVYRARHLALDRAIAIKVLHRYLTGEERIARRFHREARAASRLSHPNSLQILDFGAAEDGTLYIAMELLDGEDLRTVVDHDFPFTPERIAAILVSVLRVVEEAHRAGIIHRDLKPENIVVLSDRSGREHVKVCDFGIAKILDTDGGQAITVDGFVCGTPQYMAPEQARGDDIDHRSDIYAAGVVLYTMLVGKVPFVADTALGIITKHLTEQPIWPRARRPDLGIPEALEAVCKKAMAKDPVHRYATAAAMADALEEAVRGLGADAGTRLGTGPFTGTAAPPEPAREPEPAGSRTLETVVPPWPTRPLAIAIAVVGLVALGSVAWLAWGHPEPGAPVEQRAAPTPAPPAVPSPPATPPAPVVTAPAELPAAPDPPATIVPAAPAPAVAPRPGRRPEPVAAPAPSPSPAPEPVAPAVVERSRGDVAFEEGRRLFLANDVPGAITRFEEAARLMPRSAEVQKQLGRAYMRAGRVEDSVAAYRRYLVLAPDATDRTVVERIIEQHGR